MDEDIVTAVRERTAPVWRRTWIGDVAFLLTLGACAMFVRVVALSDFPRGLHGDEAWTVLDARDIIDGISKWPYTEAALGQPAGPMYWSVPFEAIWGQSILAARLPQAVLGVLTIAVGFYAIHVLFGRATAWTWAVLAAFSSWLIFYNRTGFTVSAFPFTEMAALLAVGTALRSRQWAWYVLAGAVVGAGIYGYFSYPLFAVGLALYVLAHMLIERPRPARLHARNVAVMGLTALLVIMPMRSYFFDDTTGYTADRTDFSVEKTDAYRDADSPLEKAGVYKDNVQRMLKSLVWDGWQDGSDGSGGVSALDYSASFLILCGAPMSLWFAWKRRQAAYLLPWIIIPIVLIGPAYNFGGYHRRALGALAFLLVLASLPLSQLWEWGVRQRRGDSLIMVGGLCIAALTIYTSSNLYRYFEQSRDTDVLLATFAPEPTAAAQWLQHEPADTAIYWFSDRWSVQHETVRYLLHDYPHRFDRSDRFGAESERSLPDIPVGQHAIVVLVADYVSRYDGEASAKYPSATRVVGEQIRGRSSFVAYVIND